MKKMTTAKAMCKAIEKVESVSKGDITRVFPLEGSGSRKLGGYDYLLVGVETTEIVNAWQETTVYEVAVNLSERTGWKVETEIVHIHENV